MRPHDPAVLSVPGEDMEPLSPWTRSASKRIFDVLAVFSLSPLLVTLLVLIAIAIRLSCGRPIMFRQVRMGRLGREFTIYKFRTMNDAAEAVRSPISAASAAHVTGPGRILRRWKLDELPQVFNVLAGQMTLVGPRPKVSEQQLQTLTCRPGLTGPATLAFAREEVLFAQIPQGALPDYYRNTILPAKHHIDYEYLRCATFFSDLRIILNTALCRWRSFPAAEFAVTAEPRCHSNMVRSANPDFAGSD